MTTTNYKNLFNKEVPQIEKEKAETRNKISNRVVGLYVWCIGLLTILYVGAFAMVYFGFSTPFTLLDSYVDFTKTLVLPVLTFVIGFYYAATK